MNTTTRRDRKCQRCYGLACHEPGDRDATYRWGGRTYTVFASDACARQLKHLAV